MNRTLLVEYYREKGNIKGVVVSNDSGIFGWSLCNPKDTFDKKKALKIAEERSNKMKQWEQEGNAERFERYLNSIPHSLSSLVNKMIGRSILYFKNKNDN